MSTSEAFDNEFGYVCPGCQSKYDSDKERTVDVDKVRRGLNTRGTAETLARIHEAKTGHTTEIRRFS